MNINDYIKDLSIKDKKTLSQKTLKLVEEVGELARVILPYDSAHGTNHRFTDRDAILEELVDVYLTNVSISHSLGFTDEEFNDMLIKKSEKWGSLQAKEEQATFPLPFEIHVTVEVDLEIGDEDVVNSWSGSISDFRYDCEDIGVKPIVIDLEINDGSVLKDVMTSSKFFGDNRTAYEESERIVKELKDRGYKVVRNKIESVPWHPAAPVISTGREIENGCYFESHIGIIINNDEKRSLNHFVNEFLMNSDEVELTGTAKLSQNFFKKNDDGKFVNMLTYRSNTCGRIKFQSEVEMIKSLLEEYCYDYEKVEIEYAVYDTNVTHDAKWIKG
jgi:NTP pyrophosphatase (non-canonical NTP hydrolase)